jgi:dihydrofolate reductase
MTDVIADITISLDGFVTGPQGAGTLHAWALTSDDPVDVEQLTTSARDSGAVVMGRGTFDVVDSPDGWRDGLGYGAREDTRPPFFVLTSVAPERVRLAATHSFAFVADPASAVARAKEAAGSKDVYVMGGARTIVSCLRAGLVDVLRVHVAPELLGTGTALFAGVAGRLRQRDVQVSRTAVHATYDVL